VTHFKHFHALPHPRWLTTPYEVGGRSTDLSQLGSSLTQVLKDAYPINQVPDDLAVQAVSLYHTLFTAEREIHDFIEAVSRDLAQPELTLCKEHP